MAIDHLGCSRRWVLIVCSLSMLAVIFVSFHITSISFGLDSNSLPLELPKVTGTSLPSEPTPSHLVKPDGLKVIALVFFGRKDRVEIMRCFLERNMVDQGGWLDEVHWVENTSNKDDLAYLEEILAGNERFKKIDLKMEGIGFVGYSLAWEHVEKGNLYIKMDDDVIWFADDTIPRMVTRKMNNPDYLVVSANMINSPLMGWVHYHMGAQHPYLPELVEPSKSDPILSLPTNPPSWRASTYPPWTGPDEYFFPHDYEPPEDGNTSRWLRLSNSTSTSAAIHRTPMAETEYNTWGTALTAWPIAAQTHYSFLENLESDTLHLYKTDGVWLTDYTRLSINFVAVWADDVLDNLPMDAVDEEWLTVNLPRKLGKSVAVEMNGLAVHFSFGGQWQGVAKTDLLGRYKNYADEMVCGR